MTTHERGKLASRLMRWLDPIVGQRLSNWITFLILAPRQMFGRVKKS
jgi:hypothetical protein